MRPSNAIFNILTVLILGLTLCAGAAIALAALNPDLVPEALRPATDAPLPTVGQVTAQPTLPGLSTPATSSVVVITAEPTLPFVAGTPLVATQSVGMQVDATVAAEADFLRVRQAPGLTGDIVGELAALTPMKILGRTPDSTWLQIITPDDTQGWVSAEFVDVYINLPDVPIAALDVAEVLPTPGHTSDASVSATGQGLRLREFPGTAGTVLAQLDALVSLDLVGRTADNFWLQVIAENGQQGWVMQRYVDVFINLDELPVTGTAVDAVAEAPATSTTANLPTNTAPPPDTATAAAATIAAQPPTQAVAATVPPQATATTASQPAATTTNVPAPSGSFDPAQYVSGINDYTRQIYLTGQSQGNRANIFSKVGDSITVADQFLSPIGWNQYNLRGYGYWADAVAYWSAALARTSNSFSNTSLAAKGGWSSFSVVATSASDKTYCKQNESPLVCEYRLTKPAVALVMIGTNDVWDTSNDAFRANLQRIISDSVSRGIIPVLSTIPAFHRTGYEGRPAELNVIVREVAQQNNVPLWDYAAAIAGLPNEGLSSDGIHPSFPPYPISAADFAPDNFQYGYTVRNALALYVLDQIRKLQ